MHLYFLFQTFSNSDFKIFILTYSWKSPASITASQNTFFDWKSYIFFMIVWVNV